MIQAYCQFDLYTVTNKQGILPSECKHRIINLLTCIWNLIITKFRLAIRLHLRCKNVLFHEYFSIECTCSFNVRKWCNIKTWPVPSQLGWQRGATEVPEEVWGGAGRVKSLRINDKSSPIWFVSPDLLVYSASVPFPLYATKVVA